jgi:hypothetical protein
VNNGGVTYPAKYEGGGLPLAQHRIKATLAGDKVIFTQGNQRFAVAVENIAQISCNTDSRRRFGAVLLAAVPLTRLDMVEEHFVGMTWNGDAGQDRKRAKVEVVLWTGTFWPPSSG